MSDRGPATLAELYVILSPLERDLLNCLDLELAKVDQFFVAREREVLIKASALRDQLQKLELHRKLFHVGASIYDIWRPNERTSLGIRHPAKSTFEHCEYRRGFKAYAAHISEGQRV